MRPTSQRFFYLPKQHHQPGKSIQTHEPMEWVTILIMTSCGCDRTLSRSILIIAGVEEGFILAHGLQAQSVMIYGI